MALTATMHRFRIELADVGRGVYETLDVRAAQHPSESARHLIARVLAYALHYEEGIEFGRGISSDEPTLWVKNLRGDVTHWIDVGQPSPERVHKASKLGARVAVYAHRDPAPWLRDLAKATIHRRDELEIWVLPFAMLDRLEAALERQERWTLTISDRALYLTRGDETLEGQLERVGPGPA